MSKPSVNMLAWLGMVVLSVVLKATGSINPVEGSVFVVGALIIVNVWYAIAHLEDSINDNDKELN